MTARMLMAAGVVAASSLLGACATQQQTFDYSAYLQARPQTLLVLPPVNDSPDVKATPAVWAQATLPLAEAGYYVLPVTLVDQTLRQNGVDTPDDAQAIDVRKLREQFDADAAIYIRVKQYGTRYMIVASTTTVQVEARMVDLRTGQTLWSGSGIGTNQGQNQGGGVAMLVGALVKQVVGTLTDEAFGIAGVANQQMLGAPRVNGVLPGPRAKEPWKVASGG